MYLIRKSPDSPLYLDAFNGKEYTWTNNRKRAWAFSFAQAQGRLYLVQQANNASACLVLQKQPRKTPQ